MANTVVDMQGRPIRPDTLAPVASLQRVCTPRLRAALSQVLVKADDTLFDLMQTSTGSGESQKLLDGMRVLRLSRQAMERAFEQSLVQAFSALNGFASSGAAGLAARGVGARGELSLVSEDELEEQLGAENLSEGLARRTGADYQTLNERFAMMLGVAEFESRHNPLGPEQLAESARLALAAVELPARVRLILYKLIERGFGALFGPLHAEANRLLHEAGVQRRDATVAPMKPQAEAAAPAAAASSDAAAANSVEAGDDSETDTEMVEALKALLRAKRGGEAPAQPVAGTRNMDMREMMSVLSLYQTEPPTSFVDALSDPSQSLAERLKRELLVGAVRMGVDPKSAQVSPADEDTLDMVGMLFEVLLSERVLHDDMRGQLSRLVVPYAKAALIDRRMFLQKAHPARKLLNQLAEAGESVTGDTPQDREVSERVEGTIDRLVTDFNEDVAIFQELERDFREFIEQYRKRMELAERRAAEAQRGKERLDQARALASAELAVRLGQLSPPPAIEEALKRYWCHHLTVVWLRQGEHSDAYRDALGAGESVIKGYIAAREGSAALDAAKPALMQGLDAMLASSGLMGEAAEPAVRSVLDALQAVATGTALPEVVRAPDHLFEDDKPAGDAEPEVDPFAAMLGITARHDSAPVAAVPADIRKQIEALQVGAWVEIANESGQVEPAKLSWLSPISERRLFVNRRGLRVCCASIEELATMMQTGKLVIREGESAFERAMHQVLGKLRDGAPG